MSGENWAVSKLLDAEKQANAIIQTAEQERQRLQAMAKESALQNVQNFRQEQETQFQNKVAELRQGDDNTTLKQQTDVEVVEIREMYKQNKDKVILSLIEAVLEVRVEISLTVQDSIKTRYAKK